MSRGGARKGAGRPKGAANKKTAEIANKAAEEGVTPLEVMLENMRYHYELSQDASHGVDLVMGYRKAAQECAKDAAPYIHPKLSSTELTGKDGGPMEFRGQMVFVPVGKDYEPDQG